MKTVRKAYCVQNMPESPYSMKETIVLNQLRKVEVGIAINVKEIKWLGSVTQDRLKKIGLIKFIKAKGEQASKRKISLTQAGQEAVRNLFKGNRP